MLIETYRSAFPLDTKEFFTMSRLTHRLKQKNEPIVRDRDLYVCLYCKEEFTETHPPEWEHLNNNPNDSRPENLVFAHKECNNRKKFNPEYQVLAHEKLIQNERAVLTCERTLADTGTTKELTSQQEINKANMKIAKQFIQEQTINNEELILRDAANAIVDICQDNNGTGSQSAVYRYIESFTNPFTGKFTISINQKGEKIIRRRTEN